MWPMSELFHLLGRNMNEKTYTDRNARIVLQQFTSNYSPAELQLNSNRSPIEAKFIYRSLHIICSFYLVFICYFNYYSYFCTKIFKTIALCTQATANWRNVSTS